MRPLFLIRQVRANPVCHDHHESAVIHVQPVGTADELIVAVSYEWAVDILAKVGLVKSGHGLFPINAQKLFRAIGQTH